MTTTYMFGCLVGVRGAIFIRTAWLHNRVMLGVVERAAEPRLKLVKNSSQPNPCAALAREHILLREVAQVEAAQATEMAEWNDETQCVTLATWKRKGRHQRLAIRKNCVWPERWVRNEKRSVKKATLNCCMCFCAVGASTSNARLGSYTPSMNDIIFMTSALDICLATGPAEGLKPSRLILISSSWSSSISSDGLRMKARFASASRLSAPFCYTLRYNRCLLSAGAHQDNLRHKEKFFQTCKKSLKKAGAMLAFIA